MFKIRKNFIVAGLCILVLTLGGYGNSNSSSDKKDSSVDEESGEGLAEGGYILDDYFSVAEVPQLSTDPSEDPYGYLLEFLKNGSPRKLSEEKISISVKDGSAGKKRRSVDFTYENNSRMMLKSTVDMTLEEGADRIPFFWRRSSSMAFLSYPDIQGYLDMASGQAVVTEWNMTEEEWEESYRSYMDMMERMNQMLSDTGDEEETLTEEEPGTESVLSEKTASASGVEDPEEEDTEEETEVSAAALEEYRQQMLQTVKDTADETLDAFCSWILVNRLPLTLADLGPGFIKREMVSGADLYTHSLRLEEIDALPDSAKDKLRLAGTVYIENGKVGDYSSRCLYDEENRLVRLDEDDTYTLYTYDDDGKLVQEEVRNAADDSVSNSYTYEYDEEGRVITETRSSDYYEETITTTYTENPDDHTLEALAHHVEDGSEWYEKTVFDEEGRELENYRENDQGVQYVSAVYEYDSNGNETKYTKYNEDGTVNWGFLYEYDDDGRMTARISIPTSEGESESRYEIIWDEHGNYEDNGYYYDRFDNLIMSGTRYRCYELPEGYTEELEAESQSESQGT